MDILVALAAVAGLVTVCATRSRATPPSFSAELEAMRVHGLITTNQLSGNVVWYPFAVSGAICRRADQTTDRAE